MATSYAVDPSVVSQISAINPRVFDSFQSAYQGQPWGPGSAQSDVRQFNIGGQNYFYTPEGRIAAGGAGGSAAVSPDVWSQGTPFSREIANPNYNQQSPGGQSRTITQNGRLFASDPFATPNDSYRPGEGSTFWKTDLPAFLTVAGLGAGMIAGAGSGAAAATGGAAEGGSSAAPSVLQQYAAGTGATGAGASSIMPYDAWAASLGAGAAGGAVGGAEMLNAAEGGYSSSPSLLQDYAASTGATGAGASSTVPYDAYAAGLGAGGAVGSGTAGYVMPGADAASSGATGGIQAEGATYGGYPMTGEAGRNLAAIAGGGAEPSAMGSFLSSFSNLFGGGAGAGAAGGAFGPIGTALGLGSSAYGLYEAMEMRKAAEEASKRADPFAPWRAGYGSQLNALMADPSKIMSDPGYKASVQAVRRQMAKGGYTMSGNEMIGLQNNFGDYYNQQVARLAGLAGVNMSGGGALELAGRNSANQLTGQSLANLGLLAYRAGY